MQNPSQQAGPKKNLKLDEPKSLLPITVLIDELKSDELNRRVNSVKHISTIAVALGPQRTRSELIPFLLELMDDEDEVLLALANSLSNFANCIGGPNYLQLLIPPLETISKTPEQSVRDAALNGLKMVVQNMEMKKNEDCVLDLVKRSTNNEIYYIRVGCVSLIPLIMKAINPTYHAELMTVFSKLMSDENPTVRKATCSNFQELVKLYPVISEKDIMMNFEKFLKEDQDFVRMHLVEASLTATRILTSPKSIQNILSFVGQLAEDSSWRVKYALCEIISQLGESVGKENTRKLLLPVYAKFLESQESELRTISATNLDKFAKLVDADDVVSRISPFFKTLATDTQVFVRAGLASSILALSPLLGRKHTNEIILPVFLTLLKDEETDVRMNIFKKLDEITKVIGIETLSQSIIPALQDLVNDKNWRVKINTLEQLTFFAKQLKEDFFNEKIIKLIMDALNDKVYAVRESTVQVIKNLVEVLGVTWFEKALLQKILAFQSIQNYLHRMTLLFILSGIANKLGQELISRAILPVLITLAKDPVPNIRMNAAKTLKEYFQFVREKDTIKKLLTNLLDDIDSDVKITAKMALDTLGS